MEATSAFRLLLSVHTVDKLNDSLHYPHMMLLTSSLKKYQILWKLILDQMGTSACKCGHHLHNWDY